MLPLPTRLLIAFNRLYARAYHSTTLLTPSTIPPCGPAIIAPNHTSPIDPLLVQSTTRRLIYWMMAEEYMRIPRTGWFWRAARIIPVSRAGGSKDSTATRAALRVLRDGHLLGIFPEGRIPPHSPDPRAPIKLLPLHPGILLLASRAGAPIHPVIISGSQRRIDPHSRSGMLKPILFPQTATLTFPPPLPASTTLNTLAATYLKNFHFVANASPQES